MTFLRRVASGMALALYFTLAPTTVPPWRSDPARRIVAELAIGEPVPSLWNHRAERLLHGVRDRAG